MLHFNSSKWNSHSRHSFSNITRVPLPWWVHATEDEEEEGQRTHQIPSTQMIMGRLILTLMALLGEQQELTCRNRRLSWGLMLKTWWGPWATPRLTKCLNLSFWSTWTRPLNNPRLSSTKTNAIYLKRIKLWTLSKFLSHFAQTFLHLNLLKTIIFYLLMAKDAESESSDRPLAVLLPRVVVYSPRLWRLPFTKNRWQGIVSCRPRRDHSTDTSEEMKTFWVPSISSTISNKDHLH